MKNIVAATFQPGYTTAKVLGLWQYDYGQILRVQGLELPDAVEIHFSLQEKGGESERQVGLTRDGVTEVAVPNSYLENAGTSRDYSIYAFLYISDGKSGNTEYKITMYVQSRPEPKDPETPEDPKDDPFGKTIEAVNKAMESTKASAEVAADSAKSASESATRAEKSAVESQESAQAATTSEKAAATSATAAAESESQSRESATIARSAADQAGKSATAAAESETTAAQQAQNAAQSATNAARSAESASQSAEVAKNAADTAGKSASTAQQAARSAAESASTAATAAQTATTAAGKTAESATSAGRSAETASKKATAAETAASKAAESATAAEKSAIAAGDSSSAAKTSETAAEEAAQTAQEQSEKIKASAEQIEKNKTDVTSLKEDLSNKITKFYASNQGETHITDSDIGKIQDMVLYGKSEQNQYKGINLLPTDISYLEIIEASIPKGTRIFWATDGTPALGGNFRFYNEDKTQETWFGVDAGKTAMTSTMNIDAKYIEFLIPEDQSVKICLGIGDDPAYEPYTGGQPSPSPDYPQEIKSVVNPIVKLSNKGGTQFETVTLPYTLNAIPVSSGGNVTIDGQQYIADYVDVERGKVVRIVDSSKLDNTQTIIDKTEWLLAEQQETDLTTEQTQALKELVIYYPATNISVNSEHLDGYTVFNYPISMENGWNYVKKQLNDNRDYIYDMDLQSAEAYVNSEYAVTLTELEVM